MLTMTFSHLSNGEKSMQMLLMMENIKEDKEKTLERKELSKKKEKLGV